jgi:hypothetical protein
MRHAIGCAVIFFTTLALTLVIVGLAPDTSILEAKCTDPLT